jgi:GTP-binding protein
MSRTGLRIDVLGNLKRPGETLDLALPVVAVAGRSNVGKSTLLNALLGRHHLLRTSRTPGCTRSIQLVSVASRDATFVVADLPGYGYANLSRERRDAWGPLIEGFLRGTRRLAAVLMLIDVRRGPQHEEQELLDFLEELKLPALVVLTKCDKLPRSKGRTAVERMKGRLAGLETFPTAAADGDGLDALWRAVVRHVQAAGTAPAAAKPAAPKGGTTKMADDPHRETFLRARDAAQKGRHDEAITLCLAILELDPKHRGALDLLGFAHFFKKEYATAEQWCRKTLEHHPDHAYGRKGLGLCLARQGKLDEGLVELHEAMRLEPKFFDPYWDTAVVLRDAGRFAEAVETLRRGLAERPDMATRAGKFLADLEKQAQAKQP